jgi:hypothetical protein
VKIPKTWWVLSRRDDILKIVEAEIKSRGHKAYLAEKDISEERMEDKLATNISDSNFVLVFWTRNVARRPETRDLVVWEIVLGRRSGKKIIAFVDENLEASPAIEQVTTYHTVNFARQGSVRRAIRRFVAQNLRGDDEVYDEFVTLVNKYRNADVEANEVMSKYGYTKEGGPS